MSQKLIDETNNRYGNLVVLYITKDKNKRTAWMCQCDCGNTKIVRGSDLRMGKITTCGTGCPCKTNRNAAYKDETNNKYGKLTVLYRNGTSNSKKPLWHCKCECGNEIDVTSNDLRMGKTISCGCGKSYGEETINNLLQTNNIEYKREYSFQDLRGIGNKPLRFDFAIFKNNLLYCLIEYQGNQHYYPVEVFGGIDSFRRRQEHDKRKQIYCKNNNIKLIIINSNDNIQQIIYNEVLN